MIANLSPSDPQGQKLCSIFSYTWLAIEGSTFDPRKPGWKTIGSRPDGKGKYPLKERSLWRLWSDPASLVGVRFDSTTQYFLIDIDKGSKFCKPSGLDAIKEALETIGINRVIAIRSSHSGGVHLYAPLPESVPTFDLACTIRYCLEAQGIFIEPGQVETFPNIKAYGRKWLNEVTQYNAHRLPLQPGSGSWGMSHDYQLEDGSLARFFGKWEYAQTQQDMQLLLEALPLGRDQHRKRRTLKDYPAQLWQDDLEYTIEQGWTGRGQTNRLLKEIGCYGHVFQGLEGDELAEFIIRVAESSSGYSTYCDHQSEIAKKAYSWGRSIESYYYPIGSRPVAKKEKVDYNATVADDAIARIKAAMQKLIASGALLDEITKRRDQLIELAKTSAATLYKNLDLWHPQNWCVLPAGPSFEPESPNDQPDPPPPLKPLISKVVHTMGGYMKCAPLGNPLKKSFYPDSEEGKGGPGEREGLSTDTDVLK